LNETTAIEDWMNSVLRAFNDIMGETAMFDALPPPSAPGAPSISIYAQANNAKLLKLGICRAISTDAINMGIPGGLALGHVDEYLSRISGKKVEIPASTEFIVVKSPQHGQLILDAPLNLPMGTYPHYYYGYLGERGYEGEDQFTLRFVVDGQPIEATFFVRIVGDLLEALDVCKAPGEGADSFRWVWPLSDDTAQGGHDQLDSETSTVIWRYGILARKSPARGTVENESE
jgi:hypothetical protein